MKDLAFKKLVFVFMIISLEYMWEQTVHLVHHSKDMTEGNRRFNLANKINDVKEQYSEFLTDLHERTHVS